MGFILLGENEFSERLKTHNTTAHQQNNETKQNKKRTILYEKRECDGQIPKKASAFMME